MHRNSDELPTTYAPSRRRPLDVKATADYLGTSERHVRELVYTRRISYVKVGRLVRFLPDDLDHYLELQRVASA